MFPVNLNKAAREFLAPRFTSDLRVNKADANGAVVATNRNDSFIWKRLCAVRPSRKLAGECPMPDVLRIKQII